jgi:hypothetical protein
MPSAHELGGYESSTRKMVTLLLDELQTGRQDASERLAAILYRVLPEIADRYMRPRHPITRSSLGDVIIIVRSTPRVLGGGASTSLRRLSPPPGFLGDPSRR